MQTVLQGISNRAKGYKEHRFGGLYSLLNEANLKWAFGNLNKAAAPGVDNVTYKEYEKNLDANIKELTERLKRKGYKAKLIRRKYIPKGNTGKMRPLGIPALEDKIVQYCVAKILEAIYEADFSDFSYGYRPNIGARDAVWELGCQIQYGGFKWVVEADIKSYFDNINYDWMVKMLKLRVDDGALIKLIVKWLKAGIMEDANTVIYPKTGTPQGGIVSPVLANIYLHYVLDLWFEKVVRKLCRRKVMMMRYADDFVCLFQDREEAEKFYRVLPKRLGKFGLEVSAEKTNIIPFSSLEITGNNAFEFLGFEFRWGKDKNGRPKLKRRTSRKKLRNAIKNFTIWIKMNRHKRLKELLSILKQKYQGYWNYYGVHDNGRSVWEYYEITKRIFFKWMNRRSQKRSFNWKEFEKILDKLPKPRITEKPPRRRLAFVT